MQADQTVLSLRPGGGNRGGSRVLAPRLDSSNSDLPAYRSHGGAPHSLAFKTGDSRFDGGECIRYTRDQLLQLREFVDIPEEILKIKQEVEAEFFGEDQSWSRGESNVQNQSHNRYFEPESRDWRGRTAPAEERSWETVRENKEFANRFDPRQQEANQYNRNDAKSQISSSQGDLRLIYALDVGAQFSNYL